MSITNGNSVQVVSATISNAGGTCLSVNGYNNTVSDSQVSGCGEAAISMSGGDVTQLLPSNSSCLHNQVSDFARIVRTYRPGVAFSGVGLHIGSSEH